MSQFRLSKKAQADFDEITDYYADNLDEETANILVGLLLDQLQKLADTTLISGKQVQGMSQQYRQWNILDGKYQVYFTRARNGNIRVLRIYNSKRRPLKPDEIK